MAISTITLMLATSDLGQLRWAISPAWELLASIRTLTSPSAHAIHLPWVASHRSDPLLTNPSLQAVRDLTAGPVHGLPGFLAPTPLSPFDELDEELATVLATGPAEVRRELEEAFGDDLPASLLPLLQDPERHLAGVVAELGEYWQRCLAAAWPRLRALLQSDIHYRARMLTEQGPAAMFADIHPDLQLDTDTGALAVANRRTGTTDQHRPLSGRGLVLVPSAFAWPRAYVKTSQPWVPVIRYPARGVGALWERPDDPPELGPVLGHTRARLLQLLDGPATTLQLSHLTGLAPSGVSSNLHKLARAGLVAPHRTGREVLYARTPKGDALLR